MQINDDLDKNKFQIGVVGGGSWGTALSNLLASKGYAIDLWVYEKDVKDQILETGENKIFLPDVKLSYNLHPTNDIAKSVSGKNMVVLVVPSHLMREITLKMANAVLKETIIVTASKGIENKTHLTMIGVLKETLAEIRRLGLKLGANPRTFTGLAGIGDLILTCTGDLSRNHTVGVKIGQGKKISDILSEMRMVAEGVKTARSVYNLSRKLGVDMPIFHEAYRILYEDFSPKEAIYRLMTRNLKQELDEE